MRLLFRRLCSGIYIATVASCSLTGYSRSKGEQNCQVDRSLHVVTNENLYGGRQTTTVPSIVIYHERGHRKPWAWTYDLHFFPTSIIGSADRLFSSIMMTQSSKWICVKCRSPIHLNNESLVIPPQVDQGKSRGSGDTTARKWPLIRGTANIAYSVLSLHPS